MSFRLAVASVAVLAVHAAHCDDFCDSIQATCTDANEQYETKELCLTECKAQKRTMLDGAFHGDTFECRDYHLTVAQNDPDTHCVHAGATGGGVCVETDRCTTFCKTYVDVSCKDHNNYEDIAACEKDCNGHAQTDMFGALSGDTYQCREYYLGEAFTAEAIDLAAACLRAGSQGSRKCISNLGRCADFCDTFDEVCGNGGNASYTDCKAECEKFNMGGKLGETSGDTLQCREYHLGVAALGRGDQATLDTHCPHASLNGGGVCVSTGKVDGNGAMAASAVSAAFAATTMALLL